MYEDEKIRVAGELSMRKEGRRAFYFALFKKCAIGISITPGFPPTREKPFFNVFDLLGCPLLFTIVGRSHRPIWGLTGAGSPVSLGLVARRVIRRVRLNAEPPPGPFHTGVCSSYVLRQGTVGATSKLAARKDAKLASFFVWYPTQ